MTPDELDQLMAAEAGVPDDAPIPMADSDLCALIDRELSHSLGYADTFSDDRMRALQYYFGEAEGDLAPPDIDNRSSVVSKDLLDAVEWTMPSMMRLFAGSDEIARFEPDSPGQEQACKDATAAASHVLFEANEGFVILHDAIKSALIQRMGVVKVWCEQAWDEREEEYHQQSPMDVEALQNDPAVEVIELQPEAQAIDPATGQPVVLAYVRVKRREGRKRHMIAGVPPEEFRIARDARTIESARFVAHEVEKTVSDMVSEGFDPDLVAGLGDEGAGLGDEERVARYALEGEEPAEDVGDDSQRKVRVVEAYLKVDVDGDGVAEYRKVVKAGNVILESTVVDDHPFAVFTPLLMPYRVVGLSLFDLLEDIVRIKTAITRQTLDSLYLANNPMREVDRNAGVDLDALMSPRPGGIVEVDRPGAVRDMAVPFVGGSGLTMLEYVNRVRDARSGVSEFNQGLASNALKDSKIGSEGATEMMAAAMQRVELMARVFAETGVKRLFRLILKSMTQYQDREMQFRVNGRWLQVNPREWSNRYRVSVSVGMGAMSRQVQVAALQGVLSLQEKLAAVGLASKTNAYNATVRLLEAMGFKDTDQFITAPDPNAQPAPPPGPPPEVLGLIEAERIKAQAASERSAQDNAVRMQVEREQMASNERIKVAEIASRERIEAAKIGAPVDLNGAIRIPTPEETMTPVLQAVIAIAEQVRTLAERQPQGPGPLRVLRDESGQIIGVEGTPNG